MVNLFKMNKELVAAIAIVIAATALCMWLKGYEKEGYYGNNQDKDILGDPKGIDYFNGHIPDQPQVGNNFASELGGCGQGGCGQGACGGGSLGREIVTVPREDFSSCYQKKQIYLNSCDPNEMSGHGVVNLEKRFGKLYISISANLPFSQGGTFHTMYGSYFAYLVDTRNKKSINLGTFVRAGTRFYKLATELLGDYASYNEIHVYRQTEDFKPKIVIKGSIMSQQCSSL